MKSYRETLDNFFFPVSSDRWLSILRAGLGLEIVFYTLSLPNWGLLIATNGQGLIISRDVWEAMLDIEGGLLVPRLNWLVNCGNYLGLSEASVLSFAWAALLCAGCLLLVGFLSRPAALAAWFLHLCIAKSLGLASYGLDNVTTIGLFYLMISPIPDRVSVDWLIRKPRRQNMELLGFFQRVLQLHLCIIYFFTGLAKCVAPSWWNGASIWRALIRPPFDLVAPELLVRWRFLLPPIGILVCLIEIGYAFFIWKKTTRRFWLICVCAMHIAIGLTMGLYLFSFVMIILNLAAFGPEVSVQQVETIEPKAGSLGTHLSRV